MLVRLFALLAVACLMPPLTALPTASSEKIKLRGTEESWVEEVDLHWSLPERRLEAANNNTVAAPTADQQLEEFNVHFVAKGKTFHLQLKRNRALIAGGAKHFLTRKNGSHELGPMPKPCYYQGTIAGDSKSKVGISTCKGGFEGLLVSGNDIISLSLLGGANASDPDADLKPSGLRKHRVRKLTDAQSLDFVTDIQKFMRIHPNRSKDRRLTGSATKYVEAFVVNDHARYEDFGGASGLSDMASHTLSVMNAVTAIYKTDPADSASFPHSIEVVLVGQQTFLDEDPFHGDVTVDENGESSNTDLLYSFNIWGNNLIKAGTNLVAYDNRILLSGRDFTGSVAGTATMSSMCRMSTSGNINQCYKLYDVAECAQIVAHEMGHNFGMNHDGASNSCDAEGKVMAAFTSHPPATQFSSCSASYISSFFDSTYAQNGECLENQPSRVEGDPICGNGFVEDGEVCDCGASDCSTIDPCCNGATCQLADASYQCSSMEGACCQQCMFASAASQTVCRAATGSCDEPEYCPGESVECPTDKYSYPGLPCEIGGFDGLCSEGKCNSLNYTCEVEYSRDFGGNYDVTPFCAQFIDNCSYMVCHLKDNVTDPLACTMDFAIHNAQQRVPDGMPCWHPSSPLGTRAGLCSAGTCVLPEIVAEAPRCGNGGIDYGEECDCGSNVTDPCCDCAACKLKEGKQCSSQEACCTETCEYKAKGTACRAETGEDCDDVERCTGTSGHCPPDQGDALGTFGAQDCRDREGILSMCYGKMCMDSLELQCMDKYNDSMAYQYPTADRQPYEHHECKGLVCCSRNFGNTGCKSNSHTAVWGDVYGNRRTWEFGGTLTGTKLLPSDEICVNGIPSKIQRCLYNHLVWTCDGSCDGGYVDRSTGICIPCSPGCASCDGPSAQDCTSECTFGQDSRGVCAISQLQVDLAAAVPIPTTTTRTVTETTTLTSSTTTEATTTSGEEAGSSRENATATTSNSEAGTTTYQPWKTTATTTRTSDEAENEPWTSTAPYQPWMSTAAPTTTSTSSEAENQPWDSTAPYQPWISTAAPIATTSEGENQAWETTAPNQPWSSTAAPIATTSKAENQPWETTDPYQPWISTAAPTATTSKAENQPWQTTDPYQPWISTAAPTGTTSQSENQPWETTAPDQPWISTAAPTTTTSTSSEGENQTWDTTAPYQPWISTAAPISATTSKEAENQPWESTAAGTTTSLEVEDTTSTNMEFLEENSSASATTFTPTTTYSEEPGETLAPTTTTTTRKREKVRFTTTVANIDFHQLKSNPALEKSIIAVNKKLYAKTFGVAEERIDIELNEGSVQVDATVTLPTEEEKEAEGLTESPSAAEIVSMLSDADTIQSMQTELVQGISTIENITEATTGEISVSDFAIATTTTTTTSTSTETSTESTTTTSFGDGEEDSTSTHFKEETPASSRSFVMQVTCLVTFLLPMYTLL